MNSTVTAGTNGSTQVWEAQTGKPVVFLYGPTESVYWAEFSPDGTQIVTACLDGVARVYNLEPLLPMTELLALARTRPVRKLTAQERRDFLHEDSQE